MAAPGECSITVGVVRGPALSGEGEFRGTCSNYLADLKPGDRFKAAIRPPAGGFRLPEDPSTPIIMVGPGTGVAPFRGFLQERERLADAGHPLGDAMLFFGCHAPDQDFLYREELEAWDKAGLVDLHTAFSRHGGKRTYVQDLVAKQADRVWQLIESGARIYVCGDGARMEPDVRKALGAIYADRRDVTLEQADLWIDELIRDGRYALDVWVG
jgi:cytochrome P450/NADPH-cytochrome P450 reductase